MTTTTYPRECAKCGKNKPPWFQYCPSCYAIVQIEQLSSNTCDEQDCEEEIRDDHFLCRDHWDQAQKGDISECPECGEYKPSKFRLCRRCNKENAPVPTAQPQQRQPDREPAPAPPQQRQPGRKPAPQQPDREPAQRQKSNTRRPYDHDDGEDDQKAKDKRYWFNRQDNGVCNYCGNRYHYDQLEMEHMIPKELGGPDHRRNMQLACKPCNEKKGTSTDIEFRQLNAKLIPLEERTPAARPVAPEKMKPGTQGQRYRDPNKSGEEGQSEQSKGTASSKTPRRTNYRPRGGTPNRPR